MVFKLQQPFHQIRAMETSNFLGLQTAEMKGLCYSLSIEWVKLVCTDLIPRIEKLNIFRAISRHRAYLAYSAYSACKPFFADDPFYLFFKIHLKKLRVAEHFRLRSHNSMDFAVRHLFCEKFFSKKIIAFAESNAYKFSSILADQASNYDAVLIIKNYENKIFHGFRGHAFAISCSTDTPILFDPNYGQFIYRGFNGNKKDLAHALMNCSTGGRKVLLPTLDFSYVRYAAIGMSANKGWIASEATRMI